MRNPFFRGSSISIVEFYIVEVYPVPQIQTLRGYVPKLAYEWTYRSHAQLHHGHKHASCIHAGGVQPDGGAHGVAEECNDGLPVVRDVAVLLAHGTDALRHPPRTQNSSVDHRRSHYRPLIQCQLG